MTLAIKDLRVGINYKYKFEPNFPLFVMQKFSFYFSFVFFDDTRVFLSPGPVTSLMGVPLFRKRSNATIKEDKTSRSSFNSQTSLIRESSPDTSASTPPRSLNGGAKQDQQRLCVVTSAGSRPSSGQFLVTSTPNHSRYILYRKIFF